MKSRGCNTGFRVSCTLFFQIDYLWLLAHIKMGRGGYSHIWTNGDVPLFYKKSLTSWVLFLTQKILKHGSTFLTEPQIAWFLENPENRGIFEKKAYFWRKILKNGYPFWPKSPLKMGMGFEARAAHPCPTQIWVPPPPGWALGSENQNVMWSSKMSWNSQILFLRFNQTKPIVSFQIFWFLLFVPIFQLFVSLKQ